MQRLESFETDPVFTYLEKWQQQLVRLAFSLWQREQRTRTHFIDYSYIVFPMAKAYEGFLKKFLFDSHLISRESYHSKRFRIGRALNPDIRNSHKDEDWVYDDVEQVCGPIVTRELWDAWLTCRNRVFHYFPDRETGLSLEQAGHYLRLMFEVMGKALSCQVSPSGDRIQTHPSHQRVNVR